MKAGSLFSGCGGMDLGFSRAGIHAAWMCEIRRDERQLLAKHFPGVPIHDDVRTLNERTDLEEVEVIYGGDPCPRHSRARTTNSKAADLSGYFLRVVQRRRARWIVRENVLTRSGTVNDFAVALEYLGYGVVILGLDASAVTAQSRRREFVIGCHQATRQSVREFFSDAEAGEVRFHQARKAWQISECLSAADSAHRFSHGSSLIYEDAGPRVFDSEERERLAGLPVGWTEGFPRNTRARFTGNCVIPHMAEWIGHRIRSAPV